MSRQGFPFCPVAQGLETKVLLSAVKAASAVVGRVSGSYFAPEDNRPADAPLAVRVDASGPIRRFGQSTLVANLGVGGFRPIGSPQAGGKLVLSNARGTVTLWLTGDGAATVPDGRVATSIANARGTGAYRGFRATGRVDFDLGPNVIQAIAYPSPVGGDATVTLRLRPAGR